MSVSADDLMQLHQLDRIEKLVVPNVVYMI